MRRPACRRQGQTPPLRCQIYSRPCLTPGNNERHKIAHVMRIAIVSDIHGNRRALDAVLADLREVSPDLIVHGGDLCAGGSHPTEIVDRIQSLGWPGVRGNTDEMLWSPQALADYATANPKIAAILSRVGDSIAPTQTA